MADPTPPRGMIAHPPAQTSPAAREAAAPAARSVSAAPVERSNVDALQRSRPPAPDFDFAPRESGSGSDDVCKRCGTTNPRGSRFCAACGSPMGTAAPSIKPAAATSGAPAPLVGAPVLGLGSRAADTTLTTTCPRCSGLNSPEMAFCQFCGTRLQGAAAQPRDSQAPRAKEGDVRAPWHEQVRVPSTSDRPRARPSAPGTRARLVVIAQDGTPGKEYGLTSEHTDVGREEGDILLPNDPYVSPRHARVSSRSGRIFLRDLGSVNGVYLRLRGPAKLEHADLVLIGLEVLRFELVSDAEKGLGQAAERGAHVFGSPASPRYARLCQRTVEGVARDVFYLTRSETVIGREAGDIVFTTDPFMSRRHAALTRDSQTNRFTLRDLGSSNGTYLAIRGEVELEKGDHLRIGQHLFRLDIDPNGRI